MFRQLFATILALTVITPAAAVTHDNVGNLQSVT
jgi:hypothetical protein